jgi:hypothetical protein
MGVATVESCDFFLKKLNIGSGREQRSEEKDKQIQSAAPAVT